MAAERPPSIATGAPAIETWGGVAAGMPARPGWQTLRALQGHGCGFDTLRYELLIRPGPRMGEAALVMADCLATLGATR